MASSGINIFHNLFHFHTSIHRLTRVYPNAIQFGSRKPKRSHNQSPFFVWQIGEFGHLLYEWREFQAVDRHDDVPLCTPKLQFFRLNFVYAPLIYLD
jgi:hypothetical protein